MQEETVTILVSTVHGGEPEALEVPRRVGNVKLGELLGEGGGGVVFAGFDEVLGRKVAVKLLHRRRGHPDDPALIELANGVRAAASIKHAAIVTVYEVEMVGDLPVIVMEFIDGVSLRELLKRADGLDLSVAMYVMKSVTSAVAALHEANIVHRDLKPGNILFDRDGGAHVCDFGLAIQYDLTRPAPGATSIGGSPLYMAPETFEGHVSPQSDVYALGILLFELLCGQPPFLAETISEVHALHVAGAAPLQRLENRGLPQEVIEIVRRALHKQRYLRFKTAGHMLRALEEVPVAEQREEFLRQRIAQIVTGGPARSESSADATPRTPARTTFDLISQRAAQKRRQKDADGRD